MPLLLATLLTGPQVVAQDGPAPTPLDVDPGLLQRTPTDDAGPQLVVLHNGSVVQGRVEKYRDQLIVSNGPWYEVRVPTKDVDFVAADFDAAYRIKRVRLKAGDFDAHQRLALWCLQHDLDHFAADELILLSRLDPNHSAVVALEQQLRRRAQVTADGHKGPKRAAGVPAQPDSSPGDDVLDTSAVIPHVSPQALAEFNRTIQPLLLNRCGQTTCHGRAGENSYQLERLHASGRASKDLTLRNLRATMAQIDAPDIAATSLAQHAVRQHGRGDRPPFGPHETGQYERLLEWVAAVLDEPSTPEDVTPTAADAPAESSPAIVPAVWEAPVERDAPARPTEKDPYDPQPFNAQQSDEDDPADR